MYITPYEKTYALNVSKWFNIVVQNGTRNSFVQHISAFKF